MSSVAVCGAFLVRETRPVTQRTVRLAASWERRDGGKMRAVRLADGAGDIALGQRDERWPLNVHGSSRRQDERKSLEAVRAAHVSRLFAVLHTYGHYRHSLTRQEKVSPSALRPAACLPSKRASLIFRMSSSCSLAAEKMTALPPSGVSPSTGVMASWRR